MSSDNEILVEVKGVSKKFSSSLKQGMWYGLKDVASSILGITSQNDTLREGEFWALRDINFTLRRGECLGLIGHNGAGKSTLLKMLNGLIRPDEGSITMRGKVGALIELGAGFNPVLTGRENVYINGQLLGFSKKEIDAKLQDILDFAEIGEFIDSPVQNYSSGMKVRLGFAVAAQMEPDVLLIDEVLAVGDMGFVLKCYKQIDKLLPSSSIIFVSHSMPIVSRICNQIILMENGFVKLQSLNVAHGIDLYYQKFANNNKNVVLDNSSIANLEFLINASAGTLNWKDNFIFSIKFVNIALAKMPYFSIGIYDKENRPVGLIKYENTEKKINKGEVIISMLHENIQLSRGVYSINVTVNESLNVNPIYRVNNIENLVIKSEHESFPPFLLEAKILSMRNGQ